LHQDIQQEEEFLGRKIYCEIRSGWEIDYTGIFLTSARAGGVRKYFDK
jgi:hypothetical protein